MIVLIIFFLLFFSALFSSMETALFSISGTKLKALKRLKKKGIKNVAWLKSNPDLLLVVLLTGNLVVNVAASALATLLVVSILSSSNQVMIIETLVMSALLLLVGEVTPKVIARRNYESLALRFAPMLRSVYYIFLPLAMPFYLLVKKLVAIKKISTLSPDDLRIMVDEAKIKKVVSEYEAVILRQLLTLGIRRVADIMTPRNSVVAISAEQTVKAALSLIQQEQHSRIVVFGQNLDNVVGIIYAKDIVSADRNTTLWSLVRKPIFIPETKRLDTLLEKLMKMKCHIAIVVDEYGGVSGLVTLEDVLESIVGEIIDEYDDIADRDYIPLGENRYLISGDLDLSVLYGLFEQRKKIKEPQRVSGYIMDLIGSTPVEGEVVKFDQLEAKISKVVGNRIVWLVVKST